MPSLKTEVCVMLALDGYSEIVNMSGCRCTCTRIRRYIGAYLVYLVYHAGKVVPILFST